MAGVLPQTNATLLEVLGAPLLSDSFAAGPGGSGSGEGEELVSLWSGSIGIYVPQSTIRLESSTDGRDEVADRSVYVPVVANFAIGDRIRFLYEGQEKTWKISGVIKHGVGVEVGASQHYELAIEVS